MKKNIILAISAIIVFAVLAISCKKDEATAKPVITLTEVGHDNSRHAMRGDDMHLEADIVAGGLIKRIDVEIHKEDGGYEIEKSYTEGKYIGVKNTEFHEHIGIPAEAPLGEYHLHFTVTDKNGRTTLAEAHIEVVEFDEHEHHDE